MTYTIFSMRPVTEKVGQIKTNGEIYATSGVFMGSVTVDGRIRTSGGVLLGTVTSDGRVSSDILDLKTFKVSRRGHILKSNVTIGAVKQTGKGLPEKYAYWAACALFFYNTETLTAKQKEEKRKAEEKAMAPPPAAPTPTPAPAPKLKWPTPQYASNVPTTRLSETNMPPPPLEEIGVEQLVAQMGNSPEQPAQPKIAEQTKKLDQSHVKTTRMPNVKSLEDYAEMRMRAFFEQKKKLSDSDSEKY